MRNKKREYSTEQLEALSLPIIERILSHPMVMEADSILLYHSLPDEVNTHDLIDRLVAMGKHVILPRVVSDTDMTLHPYTKPADLTRGAFGILEPCTPQVKAESLELHVALIPGMAFDAQGHRLGRGKGYYDRLLARMHVYKIGVCFPFQFVNEVPHDDNDITMDEVINDNDNEN